LSGAIQQLGFTVCHILKTQTAETETSLGSSNNMICVVDECEPPVLQ